MTFLDYSRARDLGYGVQFIPFAKPRLTPQEFAAECPPLQLVPAEQSVLGKTVPVIVAFMHYYHEHVIPTSRAPKRLTYPMKHGARIFGPLRSIIEIGRDDSREYAKQRIAEGAKPSSAKRELVVHHAAFTHEIKEGRCKLDKFEFVMPKASSPRAEWLTPEQYRQLVLLPKPRRLQRWILLAFGTGARASAIEELTWDRVDLDARTINYRESGIDYKNKRRVVAPIRDELYPRMVAWKQYDEASTPEVPYVIGVGARGAKSTTYHDIAALYPLIGLKPRAPRHIVRHTFASWLLQAGVPIFEVAQLLGDTVAMVEAVYAHVTPSHLMKSINRF